MSVDAHVPGDPAHVLPVTIPDMLPGPGPIIISLAKADDMDHCEREKWWHRVQMIMH
jgi:hypothetical protein